MKFKAILLVLITCMAFTASAQKYKDTDITNVYKKYKEVEVSSSKMLYENFENTPYFSLLAESLSNENYINKVAEQEMVTVFLPTNASFEVLPEEDKKALLADSPRMLQLLMAHTVPGRLDAASITKAIELNNGKATFKTLAGTELHAKLNGEVIYLENGENKAIVRSANYYHNQGFMHVIEGIAFKTSQEKEE